MNILINKEISKSEIVNKIVSINHIALQSLFDTMT